MSDELLEKVKEAYEEMQNGTPYKDYLDEEDIIELIEWAFEMMK